MTTPTKLTKYETLTRILLGDYPEPGQPFGVVWRDGAIGTAQDMKGWRVVRLPAWVLLDAAGKVVASDSDVKGFDALKESLNRAAAK